MSKELLTTNLCKALKNVKTPLEVGTAYANVLNEYILSHVQLVGVYNGIIPPAIPEVGTANFSTIPAIEPWIWPGSYSKWVDNLETQLRTKIMINPVAPPITIVDAITPCFNMATLISLKDQNTLRMAYDKNVDNGRMLTSGEQLQYDTQYAIAEDIIDALTIGFTITPYQSIMVGTGLTVFTSVIIV